MRAGSGYSVHAYLSGLLRMQNLTRLIRAEDLRKVDKALGDAHVPQLVVQRKIGRVEVQKLLLLFIFAVAERRIEDEEILQSHMASVRHLVRGLLRPRGRQQRWPAEAGNGHAVIERCP